jgi:hypothetical protein
VGCARRRGGKPSRLTISRVFEQAAKETDVCLRSVTDVLALPSRVQTTEQFLETSPIGNAHLRELHSHSFSCVAITHDSFYPHLPFGEREQQLNRRSLRQRSVGGNKTLRRRSGRGRAKQQVRRPCAMQPTNPLKFRRAGCGDSRAPVVSYASDRSGSKRCFRELIFGPARLPGALIY